MSRDVWMVTGYPLWFNNGYATNVRATIEALGPGGLAGVVSVVPTRLAITEECHVWERTFAAESGVDVRIVTTPPDFGNSGLRALSDRIGQRRVAEAVRDVGARLVHARGLRAGYLCAATGAVPTLLDVRGDSIAEACLDASTNPSPRANRLVTWAKHETMVAVECAAGFALVSDAMAEWLGTITDVRERPVEVFACPVNVEKFSQRALDGGLAELVVVYVGGLQAYQPPALIVAGLKAVAEVSPLPVRGWIVTPARHDETRELLAKSEITATLEALDHSAIQARLSQADLGIVPRELDPVSWVSCPTKIGEYLAAGVPVLAGAGIGRWAERLSRDDVGAPLGTAEAPADGLGAFIARVAADRRGFANRCRSVAEAEWSWAASAPRLLALYDSLLAEKGGAV